MSAPLRLIFVICHKVIMEKFNIEETAATSQWAKIGWKHHHGLNIPLFSLHSEHSCGIGEFPDLLPIIDWCKTLGFDVVQLLPLNDTGLDTSPYSALSANALNPIHLGLWSLPDLEKFPDLQADLRNFPKAPAPNRIDYPMVQQTKERFLIRYFKANGANLLASAEYQTFAAQSPWLQGYALYKTLKIAQQWRSWEMWPAELRDPTESLFKKLLDQHRNEVQWHSLVQFLCSLQLRKVKEHANAQGIFLKGDIPILINRDSADVWLHRSIFDLRYSAGAPPDMYSEEGQSWGFPLYNWDELAKEDYRWWIERLKSAERYYDLYRLDHVVGFFRIWAVPLGLKPKEGSFIPSNPDVWIDHGKRILLRLLQGSSMLPIGEDLGTVPPPVRTCLQSLGICGTKVMRWERYWDEDKRFIPFDNYPVISMTTVSTHDSETLIQWWLSGEEGTSRFAEFKGWSYHPILSREYHQEILWDSHHTSSLFHINLLGEYLALIPGLTWPDPEDERINIPGLCADRNWSYRYRPSVEELTSNPTLSHLIRELII